MGPPTFFDASLPACHSLWTPADLPRLANAQSLGCLQGRYNPRRPQHPLLEAGPALQGARSPRRPPGCAVDASPIVFDVVASTTPPWTQDSIRVGGSPLPDRDLHPARDAKLAWRENAWAHLLPEAGAQRTLEAVRCSPMILIEAPSPADRRGMLNMGKNL
jgi:hypothetical protein